MSLKLVKKEVIDDEDCRLMDSDWISPEEQLAIINKTVAFYTSGTMTKRISSLKMISLRLF